MKSKQKKPKSKKVQQSKYVSLHTHSDYSYRDSICKIPDLVSRAVELGYPALALTDHGHVMGALQFYKECKKQGIKPILGVEAYIVEDAEVRERSACHITLLAMNNEGWRNIVRLLTWANENGFYYSPRIDIKRLFQYHEGIIILSGCLQSMWAKAIVAEDIKHATNLAKQFQKHFGDRFYLELQMVNRPGKDYIPEQNPVFEHTRAIGAKLGIQCVATNDVHYISADDRLTHEIWKAISSNQTMSAPPKTKDNPRGRMVFNGYDYYLQTYKEMSERFLPSEILATTAIADRCDVELEFKPGAFMPRYDDDMTDEDTYDALVATCKRRIKEGRLFTNKDKIYIKRIKKELQDIKEAGLAHYFMIVDDVVAYADRNGISRGYGRGSVGGSLVAYSLGITRKVDPIKYGLVWERFYNKGRKGSMPDIDLDFCVKRRKEIIDYLKKRFGQDRIYPMSTIHALAGKMALKDVGRALGLDFGYLNKLTAHFPHKVSNIPGAIEQSEFIKNASEGNDEDTERWEEQLKNEKSPEERKEIMGWISERRTKLRMLFQHAIKLENCKRHRGTHACAIVVADRSLDGEVPMAYDTRTKELVTGWDMYDLEELGYLKLDVLGLKSVSVIADIRETLRAAGKSPAVHESESLDDKYIYKMISGGHTVGIFQLESYLGANWSRKVRPRNIEEWSDIISIIRPAVLETGMADQYATARRTGHIEYVHDSLHDILRPTQGVMLYQEQTIHLARVVAGFSLERADVLRHAVGKKKKKEMASLKDEFIEGCQKHGGCSQEEAEKLWGIVEAGAGYGFNKSHSIEYSLLGYVMAYYKFRHPVEFYKAMLEMAASEAKTREEIAKLYYDAMRHGIVIKPPTLDTGKPGFEIPDGHSYSGFTLIRGLGKTIMKKVGMLKHVKSLHELHQLIVDKNITRNAVIPLILTGAFDHIISPIRRIQVTKELEVFYKLTQKRKLAILLNEVALLEQNAADDRNVFQLALAEWANANQKQMERNKALAKEIDNVINYKRAKDEMVKVAAKEFDYLGVCISYCEADSYRKKGTKARRVGELLQLAYDRERKFNLLACVADQRYITSKKGNKLVIADLYDTTGKMTGMLVGDGYDRYEKHMGNNVLLLRGRVNGTQFMIEKCRPPKK